MSKVAEQTLEEVAKLPDVIGDAVDTVEDVAEATVKVARNNPVVVASAALLGVTVGGVAGYLVAKQRLKSYYEDLAALEIRKARTFYAGIYKVDDDGELFSPMDVLRNAQAQMSEDAMKVYRGDEDEPEDFGAATPEEIDEDERLLARTETHAMERAKRKSVDEIVKDGAEKVGEIIEEAVTTALDDETFVLADELEGRSPEKPYIIHHDEFYEAMPSYETASLTYYEGDKVLADERDQPVENMDKQVGGENLLRFGSGSKDENIVFVRNERLGIDYEITRSTGSYVDEVLALGDAEVGGELRHSNRNATLARRREFRHGDG